MRAGDLPSTDVVIGGNPSARRALPLARDQMIYGDPDARAADVDSRQLDTPTDVLMGGDPSARAAATAGDLSKQLDAASAELSTQLDSLKSSSSPSSAAQLARGESQLARLNALREQLLGGAEGVSLATLRADISAAIAATHAYASEARGAVADAQGSATAQVALQQASAAARASVTDFTRAYYEKRIFDPYLQFASAEDEEAYRRREEEHRRAIAEASNEHTPQGDLRATDLSIEQLQDAGRHGADRSAEFKPMLADLKQRRQALANAITPSVAPEAPSNDVAPTPSSMMPAAAANPALPAELLASLRAAKVSVTPSHVDGPGVSTGVARSGSLPLH